MRRNRGKPLLSIGPPRRRRSTERDWGHDTRVLEGIPDAVVAADADGRIVFVNARAEELFGYARAQLLGQPVEMLWAERVRELYTSNMEWFFATRGELHFTTEAYGLKADGSEFVGEMSWGIVDSSAGPILLAVGRDVSHRRTAETRLRAVAAISEHALAGANLVDLAAEAVELIHTSLPVTGVEVRLADRSVMASWGTVDARCMRLSIGVRDELVVSFHRDVDEDELSLVRNVADTLSAALDRRREENLVRHQAMHDPLTGLPNRALLRDRLDLALARSRRGLRPTGVMFIDLDNFKQINDTYGHATGDAVLIQVSWRLQEVVRTVDTVARLGGDEFVVVCEDMDQDLAVELGQRLREAVRSPVNVDGIEHESSASIGIALSFQDSQAVLADADVAVYRAKAQGGDRVELFC